MKKALITQAGYTKLLQELRRLHLICRVQARDEVMEAAQEGRLEKNDDYWEARKRQAVVERRIQQLQRILSDCEVLVGTNLRPQRVVFNSRVTVQNLQTGRAQTFRLVGAIEADVRQGDLSIASPLGRALLGRSPGERLRVETPGGLREYDIVSIEMASP